MPMEQIIEPIVDVNLQEEEWKDREMQKINKFLLSILHKPYRPTMADIINILDGYEAEYTPLETDSMTYVFRITLKVYKFTRSVDEVSNNASYEVMKVNTVIVDGKDAETCIDIIKRGFVLESQSNEVNRILDEIKSLVDEIEDTMTF